MFVDIKTLFYQIRNEIVNLTIYIKYTKYVIENISLVIYPGLTIQKGNSYQEDDNISRKTIIHVCILRMVVFEEV